VSKETSDAPSVDPVAADVLLVRAARAKLIEETGYRLIDLFTVVLGKVEILSDKLPSIHRQELAAIRVAAMKGVEFNKRPFVAAEACRREIRTSVGSVRSASPPTPDR
jgi:hypothetical protein